MPKQLKVFDVQTSENKHMQFGYKLFWWNVI